MSEKLLAAGSVTLMAAGSLLGATAAQAATAADCGTHPGATVTLINGTICDVVFDVAGEYDFEAPAGVTAFEAVLIGGGAGSMKETIEEDPNYVVKRFGYSGWIDHYEYEDFTGPFEVAVGAGGTDEYMHSTGGVGAIIIDGVDGGASSLGDNVTNGGSWYEYENGCSWPGPTLSEFAGDDNPLFPVIAGEPRLAATGSVYESVAPAETYGTGGSVVGTTFGDGKSGAVIIRFNLPPKLAATGVDASAIGIGAGALLAGGVALGAVAAVRRARSKN